MGEHRQGVVLLSSDLLLLSYSPYIETHFNADLAKAMRRKTHIMHTFAMRPMVHLGQGHTKRTFLAETKG